MQFDLSPVLISDIKKGDVLVPRPVDHPVVVADIYRTRLADLHNRWYRLHFEGTDLEVELHEGDTVDRVTSPASALALVAEMNATAAASVLQLGVDGTAHLIYPSICSGCGTRIFTGNTSGLCADCFPEE